MTNLSFVYRLPPSYQTRSHSAMEIRDDISFWRYPRFGCGRHGQNITHCDNYIHVELFHVCVSYVLPCIVMYLLPE